MTTKDEALGKIAFMGMDAGMHCGDKEYFYRSQLAECISIASNALKAPQLQDHIEDALVMVDRVPDAGETMKSTVKDCLTVQIDLLRGRQRVMWNLLNDALTVIKAIDGASVDEYDQLADLRTRIQDTLNIVQIESLKE